jgi:cytoskeletal protein RodZ
VSRAPDEAAPRARDAGRPRRPRIRLSPRRIVRSPGFPWFLAVLFLGAAVTFGVLWWGQRSEEAVRAEVEDSATRFLVALTNFSADTIERDVEEIRSFAIGEFADEVEETFSADRIEAIRQNQAESVGTVREVFVQNIGGDSATVFAVVDETIANRSSPVPTEEVLRVEVELIQTPEAWKVSRVEILQSPGAVPLP